jgi:hypothetical protein
MIWSPRPDLYLSVESTNQEIFHYNLSVKNLTCVYFEILKYHHWSKYLIIDQWFIIIPKSVYMYRSIPMFNEVVN